MIILQLIAALLLIPLTILLFVLFNVYLINWLYLTLMVIVGMIYASIFGLLFHSTVAAEGMFMVLTLLYILRIRHLAAICVHNKNKDLRLIRACIECVGIKFILLFPLSFIRILKIFPACLSTQILLKSGLSIELSGLIDLILKRSQGTQIEINSDGVYLNFEIL